MARKQRSACKHCDKAWRIEREFYEQSDFVLRGCREPKKTKFNGFTRLGCKKFKGVE